MIENTFVFSSSCYIPTTSSYNLNAFSGEDPANGVFSIMHSYFETFGKYSLFTKFLTSTNMPTAQQKKGHKIKNKLLIPHCPDMRGSTLCIIKSLRLSNNKLLKTL